MNGTIGQPAPERTPVAKDEGNESKSIVLKINHASDREAVIVALVANGYTVKAFKKERSESYLEYDCLVEIIEFPILPRYWDRIETIQ
jgi:intracellular sulfur oxidation DsrE/DsrF family protein